MSLVASFQHCQRLREMKPDLLKKETRDKNEAHLCLKYKLPKKES